MGVADPERLGVMGWSYGGFMTSWVVTQTKRFKAASAGAAVTNLMSFTGVTDIPGFVPDYFGGEYWDTFDAWRAHSAMFQVKGVTTPTLIQHGDADDRVPISQGYEFYNALKRQGVTTRMTVYPRQPHGVHRTEDDAGRRAREPRVVRSVHPGTDASAEHAVGLSAAASIRRTPATASAPSRGTPAASGPRGPPRAARGSR